VGEKGVQGRGVADVKTMRDLLKLKKSLQRSIPETRYTTKSQKYK
jgi:hypothetical protein